MTAQETRYERIRGGTLGQYWGHREWLEWRRVRQCQCGWIPANTVPPRDVKIDAEAAARTGSTLSAGEPAAGLPNESISHGCRH